MDNTRGANSVPDGGYGWFVCAAACVVQFVLAGLMNNFGILYIHILNEFGGGKGMSALVGSVNVGVMCLTSPFTVMVSNWRGPRIAGLVGGALSVAGLVMSSFVGQLYLLVLTYGVVFGIGCSFCYTTTYSVLSLWFDKQLSLVNGLSTASVFISTTVFSPVLQHVLVAWGLHSTLLIMAVVFSSTSIAALFYQPPPRSQNYQPIEKRATRLFDVSLFKNKRFLVLTFGLMSYCMGGYTPAVFVPSFANESGVSEEQVPFLLITWACFSILSSFVLGRVADKFRAHRLLICQITMFGVASVTAFFAVVADFVWFVSLMAVYGVFKCGFILLRPVLVQDVVGPRKTPSALGMMFGFLGISNMASYPFTGWIFDMTQSYAFAFATAAGFVAAGSSLLFLIPVLQSREDKAQRCITTCLEIKEDLSSATEKSTVPYTVLAVGVSELFEPPKKESAVTYGVTYASAQETQV